MTHLWDSSSLSIYDSPLRFSFTVYLWHTFEILLHCLFMTHLRDFPSLSIHDQPLRFSLTVYFWFLRTRYIHFFCLYIIRFVNHCRFFGRLWKDKNNFNPLPLFKKQWCNITDEECDSDFILAYANINPFRFRFMVFNATLNNMLAI